MPAGFTHILLAKTFANKSDFSESAQNIIDILDFAQDYFQVGAIGPDLPYSQMINPTNKDQAIADKFHKEKTVDVPLFAISQIKQLNNIEEKDQAFAFIMGYISHIVADGIIHPFVRDKVGPYDQNKDEHRKLEMRLDVLLLDYLTSSSGNAVNINTAKIQNEIRNVDNSFDHVAKIFSESINHCYSEKTTTGTINGWVKTLELMFEIAANQYNQYYAYIPGASGFLYKDINELIAQKDQDLILEKNEAVGRISNFRDKQTHFLNDCLPQFYRKLSPIISKAYKYVYDNGPAITATDLPAINLDTGRSLAMGQDGYDLDQPAIYWS